MTTSMRENSATGYSTARYELATSSYDRTVGLVLSLLILIGAAVALLLAIWLTARMFPPRASLPVEVEQIGDGGGLTDSDELDPDVQEVGVETEFEEPQIQETLASITDALASKSAMLEDPSIWDKKGAERRGPAGDGRAPGDGSGSPGKKRRWQFEFPEGNTIKTYAEQLEFFDIVLGVLEPGNKVTYVTNLTSSPPTKSTGPADAEQRYYLVWRDGPLIEADRKLLEQAKVTAGSRPILKFITPELEGSLVALEREAAGLDADRIRSTCFAVRSEGSGYKFEVVDQTFNYR